MVSYNIELDFHAIFIFFKHVFIQIPFSDQASIENAIHCWLYLLENGYKNSLIAERMIGLVAVTMRLELKAGINGNTLINDSYNSDIASLGIALDLLNQQHQHSKKALILSDIYESGQDASALYKEIAQLVRSKNIDRIILVGCMVKDYNFYYHSQDF